MSQGEGGGRPRKYETPEAMQVDVDRYFDDCRYNALLMAGQDPEQFFEEGYKPKSPDAHSTISGLALALDMTRHSLVNYGKDEKYFTTVKRAKLRVEAHLEQRLFYANAVGTIFNLKNNFGWVDKTEVDQKVTPGGVWEMVEVPAKHEK